MEKYSPERSQTVFIPNRIYPILKLLMTSYKKCRRQQNCANFVMNITLSEVMDCGHFIPPHNNNFKALKSPY